MKRCLPVSTTPRMDVIWRNKYSSGVVSAQSGTSLTTASVAILRRACAKPKTWNIIRIILGTGSRTARHSENPGIE